MLVGTTSWPKSIANANKSAFCNFLNQANPPQPGGQTILLPLCTSVVELTKTFYSNPARICDMSSFPRAPGRGGLPCFFIYPPLTKLLTATSNLTNLVFDDGIRTERSSISTSPSNSGHIDELVDGNDPGTERFKAPETEGQERKNPRPTALSRLIGCTLSRGRTLDCPYSRTPLLRLLNAFPSHRPSLEQMLRPV